MKVARATQKEIGNLYKFLADLSEVRQQLFESSFYEDLELEKENFFYKARKEATRPTDFLFNICDLVDDMAIGEIMCNLQTLMDNCADLEDKVLNYNKDIEIGLKLVKDQKEESTLLDKLNKYLNNCNEDIRYDFAGVDCYLERMNNQSQSVATVFSGNKQELEKFLDKEFANVN